MSLEAHFTGQVGAFRLDAAFTLAPRGFTALIGPSAAGKTTVLRCIAGLTRLDGRLVVDGETWQDGAVFLPPHRRSIGVVFQEPSLLAHLSVRGNLLYGRRRTKADPVIAFDEVVELLGLGALLARSPTHLSGGERQRVAIGRALLSQPRLLLMDEPVSSLDGDGKAEVLGYLERLHRTLAIPALYVTHDMAEVRRLADHVLTLRSGRITDNDAAADAENQLAGMDDAQVRRLALAALRAGLDS